MHFITFISRAGIALATFFLLSSACLASDSIPLLNRSHQAILQKHRQQALEHTYQNLNRYAIEELQRYDAALDSLYQLEINDSLQALTRDYNEQHADRTRTLDSLNAALKALESKKHEAQQSFYNILRRSGISLAIWLAIILVLVRVRQLSLRNQNRKQQQSEDQLALSEKNKMLGREILDFAQMEKQKILAAEDLNQQVQSMAAEITAAMPKEEAAALKNKFQQLNQAVTTNQKIIVTIRTFEHPMGTEKVKTNLNRICDECMDTAYYGMKANGGPVPVNISRDMEKILPEVAVVPEAVVYMLLNVLINAFQSVEERLQANEKGYKPKVSISTRVLPRFVQVRIKDNGEGMKDEVHKHILDKYFTTRSAKHLSGLGMSVSQGIIMEMHQGEMKIESLPGEGADVFIKLFTR